MPLRLTLPWVSLPTAVMVSVWPDSLAGPGESFAVKVAVPTVTDPSSATVSESVAATGRSLTSVTVTETVAVSDLKSLTPLVVPLSVAV